MPLPPMLQMVGMMSFQIWHLLIDMKHKANCKENPELRFTFPLGSPSNKLTIININTDSFIIFDAL